jgi:hypothetical protein
VGVVGLVGLVGGSRGFLLGRLQGLDPGGEVVELDPLAAEPQQRRRGLETISTSMNALSRLRVIEAKFPVSPSKSILVYLMACSSGGGVVSGSPGAAPMKGQDGPTGKAKSP